ncbi:Ran-specific GTPase-activating protein [Trichinella zimbabwensis]|uniref:Ran-specific GTPase-activating protein n=1 Tax=Trichinella zimbabwensis TaxID=268475 RepID=A0A0V1H4R8_9BILA|nr:Ran-specific GTPase-activating protein [Trichinella zimbabwensis]
MLQQFHPYISNILRPFWCLSRCFKTEMVNEQNSAPEGEAKYDKEDMILEQLKNITQLIKDVDVNVHNVQNTTKSLYSMIESSNISQCASQSDGNGKKMRLNNENYSVEKICIPGRTLKAKDTLILKSQEFYDSTASKMQMSAINASDTVSNNKSVVEKKIINRDEKESDRKLQLCAYFPTGASGFQHRKPAEKNIEACSEQKAKFCHPSTTSKEYSNQEVGGFKLVKSQLIADEQLLKMLEVPSDEREVNLICEYSCYVYRCITTDQKSCEEIGSGALKLLFNKRTGTYTIFMREEKSQKIVLNHSVTNQLKMRTSSLMNNAFIWHCRNTIDDETIEGTFAAVFENADCRMQFMEMVNQVKLKLNDN